MTKREAKSIVERLIILGMDYSQSYVTEAEKDKKKIKFIEQLVSIEPKTRATVKRQLYNLDWIKIVQNAIEGRPTSFSKEPIMEWRNASDQILGSMINAAEDKKIFKGLREIAKEMSKKK